MSGKYRYRPICSAPLHAVVYILPIYSRALLSHLLIRMKLKSSTDVVKKKYRHGNLNYKNELADKADKLLSLRYTLR